MESRIDTRGEGGSLKPKTLVLIDCVFSYL